MRKPARCECDDCGFDVVSGGEYFTVKSEIWNGQLGLGLNDNLCVGCLERRLGRKISFTDTLNIQNVGSISDRLADRLGVKRAR